MDTMDTRLSMNVDGRLTNNSCQFKLFLIKKSAMLSEIRK